MPKFLGMEPETAKKVAIGGGVLLVVYLVFFRGGVGHPAAGGGNEADLGPTGPASGIPAPGGGDPLEQHAAAVSGGMAMDRHAQRQAAMASFFSGFAPNAAGQEVQLHASGQAIGGAPVLMGPEREKKHHKLGFFSRVWREFTRGVERLAPVAAGGPVTAGTVARYYYGAPRQTTPHTPPIAPGTLEV